MTKKEYDKKYYQINKEKIKRRCKNYYQKNKEKIKEHYRKYRKENRRKMKELAKLWKIKNPNYHKNYDKKWRKNNKEKLQIYGKKYHQKNIKKILKYLKERRKKDINFKLACYLRNRINQALKKNYKKSSTIKLLGCSILELKQHLQNQFKIGMSWDNWRRKGWHIDHIIPCCSFDLSKHNEQLQCFNYRNLQPLWAKENLEKRRK